MNDKDFLLLCNLIKELIALQKQSIHIQNKNILEFDKFDVKIKMYLPYIYETIQRTIFNTKDFHEINQLTRIKKYIDPNKTILDIGANIGNHSIYFSKILNCKKIIAFEPQKELQYIFEKNIELNNINNIELCKFALSNSSNKLKIKTFLSNNLGATHFEISDDGNYEAKALDDLNLLDVQFVKMDVEEHEYEVLCGGKQFFTQQRPVLYIEILKNSLKKNQTLKLLDDYGYKLVESIDQNNYVFK